MSTPKQPASWLDSAFATRAVHAGVEPDPSTGAIMTPIYQTSTYVQAAPGDHQGYEYSRTDNPTRTALQSALAQLEGATHALVFGTGMAAEDTLLRTLNPGDHVVCCNDLYGGTFRLFTKVYSRYGLTFSFVNTANLDEVAQAMTPATRMIWAETPTNPLLGISDIAALAQLATAKGTRLVVDNTFASPALQNPLALGAHVVVHSLTKYMGGHSDSVMGCVISSDEALMEQLKFLQNAVGAVPGPMDCFLQLRGIKTLHLRMERHSQNATAVAQYLAAHPKVARVYYPGLASHPGHAVAARQMRAFGGMVSFYTKGNTVAESLVILKNTRIFSLAESLGGVESLIGHPATMTHASIPPEERKKAGLEDSLIRLSVGIEDINDILADLEQALARI